MEREVVFLLRAAPSLGTQGSSPWEEVRRPDACGLLGESCNVDGCPLRVCRRCSAEGFLLLDVHAEHRKDEEEESILELPEETALVPEAALWPAVVAMAR